MKTVEKKIQFNQNNESANETEQIDTQLCERKQTAKQQKERRICQQRETIQ